MSELCEREDHLDPSGIECCPRCDSTAFHIQESLFVTEYCDQIHFIDALECFKCDAKISLDLLLRLLTVEYELEEYRKLGEKLVGV